MPWVVGELAVSKKSKWYRTGPRGFIPITSASRLPRKGEVFRVVDVNLYRNREFLTLDKIPNMRFVADHFEKVVPATEDFRRMLGAPRKVRKLEDA